MSSAFAQACCSVGARIGRKATWIRGAAEADRRPRLLHGEDVGDEVGEAVVLPGEVERLAPCPGLLEDLDVLPGPAVPLVFGQEVTLALLLVITAPGDHVHGDAPVGDVI